METKFTKGEWRQSHREKPNGMYSTEVYDENGETICTLAWHKIPIEGGYATDRESNAKLIAAAPEMYEALRKILEGTSPATEFEAFIFIDLAKSIAEEALKKATE